MEAEPLQPQPWGGIDISRPPVQVKTSVSEHALGGRALRRARNRPYLLGFADSGYGWIFPKRDHANVGVFSNRQDVHLSKSLLRDYVKARLETDELDHIIGYWRGRRQ